VHPLPARTRSPVWLLLVPLVLIGLSLALTAAVDLYNVFGLREVVADRSLFPFLWFSLFHWLQVLQWPVGGVVILLCGINAGLAWQAGRQRARLMHLVLGAGMVLMLVEDAGDVRHLIRIYVNRALLADVGDFSSLIIMIELAYFAAIAAVMLYALGRFWRVWWPHVAARIGFLTGIGCYALATGSSWLGHALRGRFEEYPDLYTLVGTYVLKAVYWLAPGYREILEKDPDLIYGTPVQFVVMDHVYEESVELIGAFGLLVGVVAMLLVLLAPARPAGAAADTDHGRTEHP